MKKGMVEWKNFLEYSDCYLLRALERMRLKNGELAAEDKIYLRKRKLNISERLDRIKECDVLARHSCSHLIKMSFAYPDSMGGYFIRYVCLGCGKEATNYRTMKPWGTVYLFNEFNELTLIKDSNQELEWMAELNAILHSIVEQEKKMELDAFDVSNQMLEALKKRQVLTRKRAKK